MMLCLRPKEQENDEPTRHATVGSSLAASRLLAGKMHSPSYSALCFDVLPSVLPVLVRL